MALRYGVQRGGGFIQYHIFRIGKKRSRHGDPLPLPLGQILAVFGQMAQIPVQSRIFRISQLFGSGQRERMEQRLILIQFLKTTERDVFPKGQLIALEILEHSGNHLSFQLLREVPHIDAAYGDPPLYRFVKAA